jgi:hypothetical protein
VQPVDNHVSPYLLQPLRSYEQVQQERERRLREILEATEPPKLTPTAGAVTPPKSSTKVDQSA